MKYEDKEILRPAYMSAVFSIVSGLGVLSIGPRKREGIALGVMAAVSL